NSVSQTRKPSSSNKSLILHLPVEPAERAEVSVESFICGHILGKVKLLSYLYDSKVTKKN
ncbi:MAG: hypothetical protein K2O88_07130, partial [Paramuribaculum sp.]|nr:hypothetical protein [Paramuribaculum sp.]